MSFPRISVQLITFSWGFFPLISISSLSFYHLLSYLCGHISPHLSNHHKFWRLLDCRVLKFNHYLLLSLYTGWWTFKLHFFISSISLPLSRTTSLIPVTSLLRTAIVVPSPSSHQAAFLRFSFSPVFLLVFPTFPFSFFFKSCNRHSRFWPLMVLFRRAQCANVHPVSSCS